jgi:hypothetical protein
MLYRFNVTFAFIDYFALLVSVLKFTSIQAFCALRYRRLLHKWQLPMALQKLTAQILKITTTCSVTQRRCGKLVHFFSMCLLIGQLISFWKQLTILGKRHCVAVSRFLGVRPP